MEKKSEVDIRVEGVIGRITIHRPKALNALTYTVCQRMTEALLAWKDRKSVLAVLIDGTGERAFCAGGDIRMMYEAGQAGKLEIPYQFWTCEYRLNALIAEYPKPYIALLDGIVMGGGVGISIYGKYRICNERTLFAMPETGIGYFPDVGGSYFLSRLPKGICFWLGLTGGRLKGEEVLHTGIATHYIPVEKQMELLQNLKNLSLNSSEDDIHTCILQFSKPINSSPCFESEAQIKKYFSDFDQIQTLKESLIRAEDEWAERQWKILDRKSPLSLAITKKALENGKYMTLRQVLQQDLSLSMKFLKSSDFYEGVRAVVIDKNYQPKWNPKTVQEVTDVLVESYFQPMEDFNKLDFIDLGH